MNGSIRKRGSSWELRVSIGRDRKTGRWRYAHRTVKGSKREAQRELGRLVAEVDGGLLKANSATVDDLLDRWWSTASVNWSASTRKQTASALRVHIRPDLGSVSLAKLKASDLDQWYADMLRKPGRAGKTLSASTVVRVAGIFRSALAQALKWDLIASNPAERSTLPRVKKPQLTPPNVSEMTEILREVRQSEPALYTYLQIAATTGARRSQVCGLQWRDINDEKQAVIFCRAVVDGDKGIEVKETKTDRNYRVALDDKTAHVLGEHRTEVERIARECETAISPDAFVFSYEADGLKPWRPDGVTHRWIQLRKRLGLEHLRLHDVRHFMATTMLTEGIPVSVVAGRLGHSRASTTLNIYSHFVEAGDNDAADLISEVLNDADRDS